jgi:hypothetical protein
MLSPYSTHRPTLAVETMLLNKLVITFHTEAFADIIYIKVTSLAQNMNAAVFRFVAV